MVIRAPKEPYCPSKVLFIVQFGVGHLLYSHGTDVNYWEDNVGSNLLPFIVDTEDLSDGIYVWSGSYVDHGLDDASLEGDWRIVTREEWELFCNDEIAWDLDEVRAYNQWLYHQRDVGAYKSLLRHEDP